MSGIVKIPPAEFRALAVRPPEELELYAYDNYFLREIFWQRLVAIDRLLERHARGRAICLDLGTGSGVFLPTLARRFASVHGVDRNVADARRLVGAMRLCNVVLHERDVLAEPFARGQFAVIVAADVLEHFPATEPVARSVLDWLPEDGVFVTSLPSESWVYVLLRKIFRIEKPPDHYFTAAEVEATLERVGFRRLARRAVPLGIPGGSLFLVTAWRRARSGER